MAAAKALRHPVLIKTRLREEVLRHPGTRLSESRPAQQGCIREPSGTVLRFGAGDRGSWLCCGCDRDNLIAIGARLGAGASVGQAEVDQVNVLKAEAKTV